MHDLEIVAPPDQVRPFPANRHVGVTALGADDIFHLEFGGGRDDAFHQFGGDFRHPDLDTAVGRLKRLAGNRPARHRRA